MEFPQWLQSRLTAHGFPVGAIDGVIGENTIAALRAFQAKAGLQATGTSTPETVTALRLQASAVTPEQQKVIGDIDLETNADLLPNIVKPVWPRQSGVLQFFGPVGTSQTQIEAPYPMYLAWAKASLVRKITVHEKVAVSVERALQRIANVYSAKEREAIGAHLFGGSLNVRRMRGGKAYSMHSWGIALDFDPERNGLMTRAPQARLSQDDAKPFWDAWKAEGMLPLGEAIGRDWMHVQAARL